MEIKRKLKFILYAFALLLVIGVIGYMNLLKIDLSGRKQNALCRGN